MTDFIPLFPLRLIVYPGELLNLHIFEPRYKQLIRECDENGISFGISAVLEDSVMEIGTEMELLEITKQYETGEMDIKTKGIGLFKIKNFHELVKNKLYSGADIHRLKLETEGDPKINVDIVDSLEQLFELLKIEKNSDLDPEKLMSYDIAHQLGFSLDQEYEFLKIFSEIDRQKYVLAHLRKTIPILTDMEKLKAKSRMNGHFKKVIPPDVK